MAPIELKCLAPGCEWVSQKCEEALAERLLTQHMTFLHPVRGQPPTQQQRSKLEKVPRPVLKMGIGQDDLGFFKRKWEAYKRSCELTDLTDIRIQLVACCEEELERDMYRSLGSSISTATEAEIMAEMEKLSVLGQSNLVNIVALMSATQEREEKVRSYLARLRGLAGVCELAVQCTAVGCTEQVSYANQLILHALVRGLHDSETKEEILSKTPELDLEGSIAFVEAREAGKRSAGYLEGGSLASSQVNKVTTYQQEKKENLVKQMENVDKSKRCIYCDRTGHGEKPSRQVREAKCPAFKVNCRKCQVKGHFEIVCKSVRDGVKVETVRESKQSRMCSIRINTLADRNNKEYKLSEPIPHLELVGQTFKISRPAKQPKLVVTMQIDAQAYRDTGLDFKINRKWHRMDGDQSPPEVSLTADTGAQVTCCGSDKLRQMGLAAKNLLKTSTGLECANSQDANVMGAFFGIIRGTSASGEEITVRSLVYVLKTGGNLLSLTCLRKLGVIHEDFPKIGCFPGAQLDQEDKMEYKRQSVDLVQAHQLLRAEAVTADEVARVRQPPGSCDTTSSLPCSCARRVYTDPPESLPMSATPANRGALEDWIKSYYSASAFNTCKRQSMPCTAGPKMRIFTQPGAIPVAVHKPAPVPLHWRTEVKAGIDADVVRGVLEKVPVGVPTTWQTRMVLQPKKDGKPRRTVDLSALSKSAIRETHHTRSPFKVACSVPAGKLKSVLDCADGYHGVEIAEEDKHKTTFITEWGRYRYCRAPQGYGGSGDGYTKRTDDVLEECPAKPETVDLEKIVDDILTWSDTIEAAFFRICNILSHCSKNGMIFNVSKFKFAQEEVEFAGIMIGMNSVRPTDSYKQAILDFPRPTNISEIRSWFGLVNQVAYCFAKGTVMAPFRPLLSSKSALPFYWNEELEAAFKASKEEIVKLVEDGVRTFEPNRTTCLSTDFCKSGLGWILQQKHCMCPVVSPLCCTSGWKLVLAGGRFTIPAESRYSPTEGEALGVAVGLEGSRFYTLGCPDLYIATDHQPLLGIMGDRALDTIKNPRLVKIKERTMWWNYQMVYVPGKKQAAADTLSRRKLPVALHTLAVVEEHGCEMEGDLVEELTFQLEEITMAGKAAVCAANVNEFPTVLTWEKLKASSAEDPAIVKLVEQVQRGFPDTQAAVHPEIREFHQFRHGLTVVDGVVSYKTRLVIPSKLRGEVLSAIHAAHQGVSGMTSRADQSVFWPGLSSDLLNTRHTCMGCNRIAPSNPAGVPVTPPSPSYPFQLIVGDYFSLHGHNYLVLADRFSGWFSIYKTGQGEFDGKALIKTLREHFITYGVSEEFSSDMGPQLKSSDVSKFLSVWGVYHRQSSAYFPHSNSRAELAVKTGKRLLMDNVDSQGGIDTDKFGRAVLQYRNTPLPDTRLSPAQIIYGRQLRDFIPVLSYKYEPRQEWVLLQEDRDRAMARRLQSDGSRLEEHTRSLPALSVGDAVMIQNQTGRSPTKWDKSGVVLENMPYEKLKIRVDGSRRVTERNRRFVKKILPPTLPLRQPEPRMAVKPHPRKEPVADGGQARQPVDGGQARQPVDDGGQARTGQPNIDVAPPLTNYADDYSEASSPAVVSQDTERAAVLPGLDQSSSRPQRIRKANSRYDPEVYDLTEVSYVPLAFAMEMVSAVATRGISGSVQPGGGRGS